MPHRLFLAWAVLVGALCASALLSTRFASSTSEFGHRPPDHHPTSLSSPAPRMGFGSIEISQEQVPTRAVAHASWAVADRRHGSLFAGLFALLPLLFLLASGFAFHTPSQVITSFLVRWSH